MESWTICRFCLQSKDVPLKTLPEVTYNMIPFFNIYFELVGITFTDYPSFPGRICSTCETELIEAYKFREKCLETEEKLKVLNDDEGASNIEFVSTQGVSEPTKVSVFEPNTIVEEKPPITETPQTEENEENPPSPRKKVYKVSRKEMQMLKTKSIQCTKCRKLCYGIAVFRNHKCADFRDYRPVQKPVKEKEKKVYQCDKCGRTFLSMSSYYLHMDKHKNILRYPCQHCDEKFSCWIKRRTHIYKVHLKKSYLECNECGKGFNKSQDLKNHKNNFHLDINLYQCEVCGKPFKRMRDLRFHVQSHKDKMKCKICGKKLKHMRTLMTHMKTHGKLPKINCPVCFREVVGHISLEDHVQRLHPDKIHLIPSKDSHDIDKSPEEQDNK